MNKKAIFISAQQPRSGKDLSAKYLQSFFTDLGYNCEIHAFKDKLIQVACDILNISVDEFLDGYDETSEDYLSRFTVQDDILVVNMVCSSLAEIILATMWFEDILTNVNNPLTF